MATVTRLRAAGVWLLRMTMMMMMMMIDDD